MIAWLTTLEPHWLWLSGGLLLAILEIVVPGVFLIWLGVAALLTGLVTALLPIPEAAQLAIFAATALGTVYAGRRWFATTSRASEDPLLNDRTGRLVGEIVTVCEAIESGRGRVRVGDGAWPARGDDAPLGAKVRVIGTESGALVVTNPARAKAMLAGE